MSIEFTHRCVKTGKEVKIYYEKFTCLDGTWRPVSKEGTQRLSQYLGRVFTFQSEHILELLNIHCVASPQSQCFVNFSLGSFSYQRCVVILAVCCGV